MALFPSLSHSQNSFEKRYLSLVIQPPINSRMNQRSPFALKEMATEHFGLRVAGMESREWTSAERLRPFARLGLSKFSSNRNDFRVYASCSRLASSAFTLGTAFVLPFYTLMVLAPKAELTKKLMKSTIPYSFLGVMYAYLLSLSWTPATLRSMFASKYLLPQLPGMVKLFSNEMTLASAWIHLLAIDLFAARQVYWDGLENEVETRHSVSLCLLFCPIGILSHIITTSLTKTLKKIN